MNSKDKGNNFERKISKMLSERFKLRTGLDQAFRRNVDSGSFFGGSNQRRAVTHDTAKATFGDIVCPAAFKFSIECKHYKTAPSFAVVFKQDFKQWDTWLEQASQDSVHSGRPLLLIVKYNGLDEFVMVEHEVPGLDHTFRYKNYRVFPLKSFLMLGDDVFFDIEKDPLFV